MTACYVLSQLGGTCLCTGKRSFRSWRGKLYKDFFKPLVQAKTTAHSQFSSLQALL